MPLINQFPNNLACVENDLKNGFESLTIDGYAQRYQIGAGLEYFGKVPLNRQCAHDRPMEQLSKCCICYSKTLPPVKLYRVEFY